MITKPLFLTAAVVLLAFTGYAQKVNLALKLVKGNTYHLITTTNSSIKQTISGQANNIDMVISGTTSFKVLNADDSLYYTEVNYKSLSINMLTQNGKVVFDSQKRDSSDAMSAILGSIINKPFKIIFTRFGKVRSVEGIENIISSMVDNFPKIAAAQKQQIKQQFIQSFGAGAVKSSIELGTAIFPAKPVSKNEKWTISSKIEGAMSAMVNAVFELTDDTGDNYTIHGNASVETDSKTDYSLINGIPMKYNMKGTIISDIKTDKTTGWITESKIKQQINGSVNIKDNPQVPGGLSFPMNMINETVTTSR